MPRLEELGAGVEVELPRRPRWRACSSWRWQARLRGTYGLRAGELRVGEAREDGHSGRAEVGEHPAATAWKDCSLVAWRRGRMQHRRIWAPPTPDRDLPSPDPARVVLDLAPGGAAMAVAGSGSESGVSGERKESEERDRGDMFK